MKRTARCVALALALSAAPAAAAAPYAPPAADELSALERHHHPHDWWRVTVDSARYEVKVRTVDGAGIAGLRPRHRSDLVPERIAWSEIARIDARKSHFRSKQVQGVIYGGIAGPVLALAGGLQDPLPVFAVFVGAGLGGWLGGLYGDTQVHELPLYISRTLLAPAPIDSTRDVVPVAAPLALAAGSAAPAPGIARGEPTPQVLDACRMIRPSSILRVRADFGMFEGTAERAEPEGLSGLRMSSLSGAAASSLGLVSWDRIELVDVKGNKAGSGAIAGALSLGALGGLVGLFAIPVAAAGSGVEPSGWWILAGAGMGATAGAGIGAAVGAVTTSWRTVYRR